EYQIEHIYHPTDKTTDPFDRLLYLQNGTMTAFSEMGRKVVVNGNEITDYYGFANMIHDKKRNEFSFKMSFYDTDIVITDMFTETGDPEAREKSNVQIRVDGTDYANPT